MCGTKIARLGRLERRLVPAYGAGMNPFALLFLLFLLVPLVEIYFLIEVGDRIGAISTIGLVVFTAVLGAMLLRLQGLATLQRTRITMAQGQLPAIEMFEGVLLVFAGALLLTPGFVTDAIGFGFLLPPLRRLLIHWFLKRSSAQFKGPGGPAQGRRSAAHTLEGEYRREDD